MCTKKRYAVWMDFSYTVKQSARSRSVRVAVHPDGAVVVTASKLFSERAIERFIEKHRDWIQSRTKKALRRTVLRISQRDVPELKHRARTLIEARLHYFNTVYGYTYKTIRIGAQKTRWGSCSRTGTISFNYKIAALPTHLADYIVVHELAHLGEMNHSKSFWALVARTIPDSATCRKELRNIVIVMIP